MQRYLKLVLEFLEKFKNVEGKVFVVYICNLLVVLVGVVCLIFIIIDIYKVYEEVGGKELGLLVFFDLEFVKKDEVFDGIVNWIFLRMRRFIKDYFMNLYFLVFLQVKSEDEFVILDIEDLDILNVSIEIERYL